MPNGDALATKEFREFERVEDYGSGSLIATGLVRMDPRTDHVRQKLLTLPAFGTDGGAQVTFFSPDPEAQPMIVWDLTLVREPTKTFLKITGQTIDAEPAKKPVYYANYVVIAPKPNAQSLSSLPIGAIIAWYSKDEKLPEELAATWALCNGQSPVEGLPTTPILNDGRFLRGNASPANPGADHGGRSEHSHTVTNQGGDHPAGFLKLEGQRYLGASDSQNHLPPFRDVRFIIRYR